MDLFCKIANKQEKSHIIYEDNQVMAFLDIDPFSNGHTIIIPKQHYQLDDIPSDVLNKIMEIAKQVSQKIQSVYHYDGVVILSNSGKLADIPHFHLHVYGMNAGKKNSSDYEKFPLDKVQKVLHGDLEKINK
jgi:diadenosine tetraphosphate (Ap4A) HIT family hydrolase